MISMPEIEKEQELTKLIERATAVLGSGESAQHWLKTPKKALGGQIPIEVAKTKKGLKSVYALLGRIEHGVFS